MGIGPARGDEKHWFYETYNLAPYLKIGSNSISIQQWYIGKDAPIAQHQMASEILVQGNSSKEWFLNSGNLGWKVKTLVNFYPLKVPQAVKRYYFVAGPGDSLVFEGYPEGWQNTNFKTDSWPNALRDPRWTASTIVNTGFRDLTPRTIPAMEFKPLYFIAATPLIGRGIQINKAGNVYGTIRANEKTVYLLDLGVLSTGYPQLKFKGGKGAKIKLTYAEALFNTKSGPNKRIKGTNSYEAWKGNRNEFKGKSLEGNEDVWIADGLLHSCEPLWQRTFRFVKLEMETQEEPLILENLSLLECTYPFDDIAYFRTEDNSVNYSKIQEVAFRTVKLCAGETYFDCPYYEQLQYIGDTRIQALISYYRTGDDRLAKKAIQDFANSIIPEGITQSRYPSNDRQLIPTFSLIWIGMLHDYYYHRPDKEYLKHYLGGIYSVLNWWERYLRTDKILGPTPFWNFTDWTPNFRRGDPDEKKVGGSINLSFQYVIALQQGAEIMRAFGRAQEAERFSSLANEITTALISKGWDSKKLRFKDFESTGPYSQHTQILACLANAVSPEKQASFLNDIASDTSLFPATIYFRFYLFKALEKAGKGSEYLNHLKTWDKMLNWGLTTFPESEPELEPRSDCHAWSASPLYDLLRVIAGIKPGAPSFESILIEPNLGNLQSVKAKAIHWAGPITLDLKRIGFKGLQGTITLPEKNIPATFKWQGQEITLKPGLNLLKIKD